MNSFIKWTKTAVARNTAGRSVIATVADYLPVRSAYISGHSRKWSGNVTFDVNTRSERSDPETGRVAAKVIIAGPIAAQPLAHLGMVREMLSGLDYFLLHSAIRSFATFKCEDTVIDGLIDEVRRQLSDHCESLHKLTKALATRRTLSGDEIREIVLGGPMEKAEESSMIFNSKSEVNGCEG